MDLTKVFEELKEEITKQRGDRLISEKNRNPSIDLIRKANGDIISEKEMPSINLDMQMDRIINNVKRNFKFMSQPDRDRVEFISGSTEQDKKDLLKLLRDRYITKDAAEEIIKEAGDGGNLVTLLRYLKTPEIQLTLESITGGLYNLVDLMVGKGFTKPFSLWLIDFAKKTNPVMGSGEVALALMLRDGRITRASEQGDIYIGDTSVEVKINSGRLRSTKGLAQGAQVRKKMVQMLNVFLSRAGYPEIGSDLPKKKSSGGKKQVDYTKEYNWQKDGWQTMFNMALNFKDNWAHEKVLIHLAKIEAVTKEERINFYRELLNAYFLDDKNPKSYDSWLKVCFDSKGNIKPKEFINRWMSYAYEYYKKTDKFDLTVVMDKKVGTITCVIDDLYNYLGKTISNWGVPNLSDEGNVQGQAFSIGIVKKGAKSSTK